MCHEVQIEMQPLYIVQYEDRVRPQATLFKPTLSETNLQSSGPPSISPPLGSRSPSPPKIRRVQVVGDTIAG